MQVTKELLYEKWAFVEKDIDQEHWYIRLEGGKYHDVVYKFEHIKFNETNESIDFDYDVIDYPSMDDPTGTTEFNTVTGEILKLVLDDAFKAGDYVLGHKESSG